MFLLLLPNPQILPCIEVRLTLFGSYWAKASCCNLVFQEEVVVKFAETAH